MQTLLGSGQMSFFPACPRSFQFQILNILKILYLSEEMEILDVESDWWSMVDGDSSSNGNRKLGFVLYHSSPTINCLDMNKTFRILKCDCVTLVKYFCLEGRVAILYEQILDLIYHKGYSRKREWNRFLL